MVIIWRQGILIVIEWCICWWRSLELR